MSLQTHLVELERKHRSLDSQIETERHYANADEARIASLKRKKLRLKDEITKLRTEMVRRTFH